MMFFDLQFGGLVFLFVGYLVGFKVSGYDITTAPQISFIVVSLLLTISSYNISMFISDAIRQYSAPIMLFSDIIGEFKTIALHSAMSDLDIDTRLKMTSFLSSFPEHIMTQLSYNSEESEHTPKYYKYYNQESLAVCKLIGTGILSARTQAKDKNLLPDIERQIIDCYLSISKTINRIQSTMLVRIPDPIYWAVLLGIGTTFVFLLPMIWNIYGWILGSIANVILSVTFYVTIKSSQSIYPVFGVGALAKPVLNKIIAEYNKYINDVMSLEFKDELAKETTQKTTY